MPSCSCCRTQHCIAAPAESRTQRPRPTSSVRVQRKARENVRPAPIYQAPDDALLVAAPPLQSERDVTEVHKLGQPLRARSAQPTRTAQHGGTDAARPKHYELCYSAQAQQAAGQAILAAKGSSAGFLSPGRPAAPPRLDVSRSAAQGSVLDGVKLYQKQQWMTSWLEARGGIEPADAKLHDRLQLREAMSGPRLLSVQSRRLGGTCAHATP